MIRTNFQKYYSFEEYISSPNAKSHKAISEKWLSDWKNSNSYQKHIDTINNDKNLSLVVVMRVIDQDDTEKRKASFIDIYSPDEITDAFAYKTHIDSLYNFFVAYKYIPAYCAFRGFIYIDGLHLSPPGDKNS